MKRISGFLIIVSLLLCAVATAAEPVKTLFNNGWKFALGNAASMEKDFSHGTEYFTYICKVNSNDHNRGPAWSGFDDSLWRTVNLPHDWVVDLPYSGEASHSHGYKCIGWKYPENSVGWYRKRFIVPQEDKGKEIGIEFEGIFRDAEVFCDEMGFFVIDENRSFGSNEEQLRGLENMIVHHKHHPCIIAWSVGNEEWSVEWNETGTAIARAMRERANQADPTRPTTYGSSGGQAPNYGVEVFGYNYIIQNPIEQNHKDYPGHCAIGTEETTGCGTRGEYVTVEEEGWMIPHNRRDSIDHIETGWRFYKERPWLAGLCYWTGFDYRGESNPMVWPATGSQFGIFDYCGFPKDEAYYLKAWWTDEPVLHICGPANGHVRVYSNCEEVELFRNGKSLGRKIMPRDGHLDWNTDGAGATFTAKGYSKGRKTLKDIYPEKLEGTTLKASKTTMKADGQDVIVVDIISVEDRMDVSVDGATLLGWGNGNPGFKEVERPVSGNSISIRTFNGRARYWCVRSRGYAVP